MAKTSAERQAKYRAKREFAGDMGEKRINTWIKTETWFNLSRLARHCNVTQREMLEKLIQEANQKIIDALDPDEDFEAWKNYTSAVTQ